MKSPFVMYSPADSSGRKPGIAGLNGSPASAVKISWSALGVSCWKPCGYSSSSAAVWSFFWKTGSISAKRASIAFVSGSDAGDGPR